MNDLPLPGQVVTIHATDGTTTRGHVKRVLDDETVLVDRLPWTRTRVRHTWAGVRFVAVSVARWHHLTTRPCSH